MGKRLSDQRRICLKYSRVRIAFEGLSVPLAVSDGLDTKSPSNARFVSDRLRFFSQFFVSP